ncbi:MAG TPA: glycosyltransferase family 87 protein [Noviherbaspirillum sp.]
MKGQRTTDWVWLVLLALCLAAGGYLSVRLGQDANWDLKNYHIYNPWAFLHGRFDTDLFAAGLQTYFNPLLDLPYYFLAFEWLPDRPKAVAFLMGLPYGLMLFCLLYAANIVLADLRITARYRIPVVLLLAAFGASGAATVPQVGTTFNEVQIAALIIAGVAILLSGLKEVAEPFNRHTIFWGGLLFGLAAGLKLTAGIYAPAAVIALVVVAGQRRHAFASAVIFSLAWGIGFALTYGWWAYHLYTLTGNPMFPLFEGIFGTSWLGSGSWMDNQFKAKTATLALLYPFFWIDATARTVAEPIFSDPRFAIALLAFFVLATMLGLRHMGQPSFLVDTAKARLPRTSVFTLIFIAIAYALWLKMFSILRYAVSIEVMLGLAIGIILVVGARLLQVTLSERALLILAAVLLAGAAVKTKYPEWGRADYGTSVLNVQPVALLPDSMLILLGSPNAYVLPDIARQNRGVQFVGITDDLLSARKFDMWKTLTQKVQAYSGPKYALVRAEETRRFMHLSELKLAVDDNACQSFATNIDGYFKVCPLRPLAP